MTKEDRNLKLFGPAVVGFSALTFATVFIVAIGLFLYQRHQDSAIRDTQGGYLLHARLRG